MKIDYDKLYHFIAGNEETIKDVIDVSKVFGAVAGVFSVSILKPLESFNVTADIILKSFQVLTAIGGFIYVIYKIIDIHKRHRQNKRNKWRN